MRQIQCERRIAICKMDTDYDEYGGRSYTYWSFVGKSRQCLNPARFHVPVSGKNYCGRCVPYNVSTVVCLRCNTRHPYDGCCGQGETTGEDRKP